MNVLAIDFGLKRIGLAVGSTASGIPFLREAVSDIDGVSEIVKKDNIERILLGLPLKRDGAEGDIVEELRQFSKKLEEKFHIPIEYLDERYTTKIASAKLKAVQMKAKEQKKHVDSLAAQIMLQEWLDEDRK